MNKKVLILVNHDIVLYNFRRELVETLLSNGFDVYISSPYGERIEKMKEMGCKYYEIKINRHSINPLNDFKLIIDYYKQIKLISPDVILTYTIKPNIYGGFVSQFLGVPYIANITGLGSAVENKGMLQKISLLLYKLSLYRVQTVFFQNKENMAFFTKHKIAINHHQLLPGSGVNLNQFCLLPYPKGEIWKNKVRTIDFTYISRIMREKGIDEYLEMAKYIHNHYPFTRFHILGFCEEAYESKLKEMQNQGIIIYHGMQSDIIPFLLNSHCTIHPSYYPEGMSNVCLESAACGRPVITTTRSGCFETVDDGVTGFLVAPKNTEQLIKAVEKFIHMDFTSRKKMGIYAREKMVNEFNRDIVVKAYTDVIKKIC